MEADEPDKILENDFAIEQHMGGILRAAEGLRESRIPRQPHSRPVEQAAAEPNILERTGSFLAELDGVLAGSISL